MIYDLSKEFDRKRAEARWGKALEDGAMVEFTIKTPRSLAQNSYLHCLLGALCLETGNNMQFVKEQYYKRLCNPDLFVHRAVDPWLGPVETLRSSADLTKEEMSLSIDRFKRWASENGIYLPEPGDAEMLQQIQYEMDKVKAWL